MAARLGKKITANYRKQIERELQRYKGNHYIWHKHVTGVELDPHQVAWMNMMDKYGDSHLLIGSRRIRKSFTIAAYLLEEAATNPFTEVNVHSPALEQSKRNLRYMTDMILNSEILLAYIEERLGEGIGKEHIEFLNGSKIEAKGQASSVDGLGATHQWLEEFDDMDWDTFLTRIFPTGSQIKPNHHYGQRKGCFRIITGTIKGIGNIYSIEHPQKQEGFQFKFNVLPKVNCYAGIAMGIIPEQDILIARAHMTPHQFARTYLVLYVESANFYPDKYVRACANNEYLPVPVIFGEQYPAQGDVTVGIDCGGAGETSEASNWAITFTEKINNKVYWLYSKEWEPNVPPGKIRREMLELLSYFRPLTGYGDAFDITFLWDLNLDCKRDGLTRTDVRRYENKSGPNGWDNWYIKPIRFHGPAKHLMHERMQKYIYARTFQYPAIVQDDSRYKELEKLIQEFGNVKAERTNSGYNKYSPLNSKLGLDIFDSCIASIWAQEEIDVIIPIAGGHIPQMEIGPRHVFANQNFLYDTRPKDKTIIDIFSALRRI